MRTSSAFIRRRVGIADQQCQLVRFVASGSGFMPFVSNMSRTVNAIPPHRPPLASPIGIVPKRGTATLLIPKGTASLRIDVVSSVAASGWFGPREWHFESESFEIALDGT